MSADTGTSLDAIDVSFNPHSPHIILDFLENISKHWDINYTSIASDILMRQDALKLV